MPNAAKRAEIKNRSANKTAGGTQTAAASAKTPSKAKASPAEAAAEAADKELGEKVQKPKAPSIRNTIITMLTENKSTKEITDVLQSQFPGTKAAEKPSKHIAFYRSRMKKDAAAPAAE
jgi:hypothetical protein